jgi:hypothetical protein
MNLRVSSTWKNARSRYIVGAGGAALAVSVAVGGISALASFGSREGSVPPQFQSQPQTLIGTTADAEIATPSVVFAEPVSQYLDQPLSPIVGETRAAYLGVGQTAEGVASSSSTMSEALGAGMNPYWATTLADWPVDVAGQP